MNTDQKTEYDRALDLLEPALRQLQNAGVRSEVASAVLADIAALCAFKAGGIKAVKRLAEGIVGKGYAWLVDDGSSGRTVSRARALQPDWECPLLIEIPIAHPSACHSSPVQPSTNDQLP